MNLDANITELCAMVRSIANLTLGAFQTLTWCQSNQSKYRHIEYTWLTWASIIFITTQFQ